MSEGICFDNFEDFVKGGSVLRLVTPAPTHQFIQLKRLWVVLCAIRVRKRKNERGRQRERERERESERERKREREKSHISSYHNTVNEILTILLYIPLLLLLVFFPPPVEQ